VLEASPSSVALASDGQSDVRSSLERSRFLRALKRAVDFVLALVALVALAPVFVAISIAIKCDSRGPVFFRQVRIGTGGRAFGIYKFRTMKLGADERKEEVAHLNVHLSGGDARMFKILDDPRVTSTGKFLRRYFLDELPQLINVLRGEMSLVGPRPLIPEEDSEVPEWAMRRLSVRPGMTGTWQVHGHSRVPFEQMVLLDRDYVRTWSLRRDFGLIIRTIPLVVRGDGDGR
jgi:lipopolysaccharide/colanic/teichoic acid biosynthesis glycosyltransferase